MAYGHVPERIYHAPTDEDAVDRPDRDCRRRRREKGALREGRPLRDAREGIPAMWTWLDNNLHWILPLVIGYVVERVPELSAAWKRRAMIFVDSIERASRIYDKDSPQFEAIADLKRMIAAGTPTSDRAPIGDLIAEAGDDKHARSIGRKVASGVVHLLPLLSRFRRNSQ